MSSSSSSSASASTSDSASAPEEACLHDYQQMLAAMYGAQDESGQEVVVRWTQAEGRYLVVNRAFEKGEVILEDTALVSWQPSLRNATSSE